MPRKRILLVGSTGSIGLKTLEVVENLSSELSVACLAAHSSWERLLEQTRRFRPEAVALTCPEAAERFAEALRSESFPPPRVYRGPDGLLEMVRETEGDVLVAAISGAAGLPANLAALETGKDIALANKESLVMSGALLTRLARQLERTILPVDSEHSAIFQSMLAGSRDEIRAVILTASGGPFRGTPSQELERVTPEQALKHPTWDMGAKITIDSATLMNKALEVIEARWLFDLRPEQIEVIIHPQSIIHSMVEYHDGSTICHLGPPDMKIPIQYALTYPRRRPLPIKRLRWAEVAQLTFEEPDLDSFPALGLAYEVLERGGTAPTVFNAANEVAVATFLRGEIPFPGIVDCVGKTVESHRTVPEPSLDDIFEADAWARAEADRRLKQETAGKVTDSPR
ncbi:MAG: 1-deoxy-D-xylulose-5-phosphate reductoisomerase [Planctomycetota bacterium]|nr:1-deoxy-D-xylulose-5-phosphate reductoisomerase [Planctomycetota bacterium]